MEIQIERIQPGKYTSGKYKSENTYRKAKSENTNRKN